MAAVKRQRQNTTFKESKFHRENNCYQSWLQKSSQAKSGIVVLSRKLHMYCSHGNKLMQERQ